MNCPLCNLKCRKYGTHRNGLKRFRCPQCGKTYTEEHARLFGDMIVPEDKALLAIQLLIEGTSVRSAERITQLHRDTILRLLVFAGERCIALMDSRMRNLHCKRLQSDEIWTFCTKKQRNVRKDDPAEFGDQWVFVALDADTKLVPYFEIGKRTKETTIQFLTGLQQCLNKERFQITTDGYHFYRSIQGIFGGQADFAQMIKLYGDYGQRDAEARYSPSPMIETIVKICDGRPDPDHISTSFVERQNLTMRQAIKRFARLTLGYSKKLDNLKAACALHFAYYNFCRVHSTLRVSPAVEAGLTDHIWSLRELLATQ